MPVLFATSTEPSPLTVKGPLVTGVMLTLAGLSAAPLTSSLSKTFNTSVAPVNPSTAVIPATSSIASILLITFKVASASSEQVLLALLTSTL
ncbi:hypothetical protein ZORO111903_19110 [Zobellia roscoffensis]